MGYAKTLTLQLRVGDLDLPERRKRHTQEPGEDAPIRPCSKAKERTNTVGNVTYTRRNGMCWRRK